MPFNMELRRNSNKVCIKLQVVQKVINIYFTGEVEDASEERDKWLHLERHFIKSMPDLGPENGVLYTTDAYHQKKEHTNDGEGAIYHLHRQFKVEVTPELLASYLNKFWHQQYIHATNYQFLSDFSEVGSIIKTFSIYYEKYKDSSLEFEYEKDNELTEKEQEERKKKIEEEKLSKLLTSQNSPVFASQPPVIACPKEDKGPSFKMG